MAKKKTHSLFSDIFEKPNKRIENIPKDVYEDDSKLSDLNLSILIKYIKECDYVCDFGCMGGIKPDDISSEIKQRAKFAGKILFSFVENTKALDNAGKDGTKFLTALTELIELRRKGEIKMHNILSPKLICVNLEIYDGIFKRFISTKYKAPVDPVELRWHLEAIFLFYRSCKAIPQISYDLLLKVDYALAMLSWSSAVFNNVFVSHVPQVERIMLSKKRIQSKKAEWSQTVIEEYYKIKGRDELSKHGIAKKIHDRWKKMGIKTPSLNTIKKYLKEDPKIKRF